VTQRCVYRVDLAGADDMETRYHIWEAMVALQDMCEGYGKGGTAYGLGQTYVVSKKKGREG